MPQRVERLIVDKHNRDAVAAFEESVRTGRPVLFLGPVGAGKTTLLREIEAQLRERDGRTLSTRTRCAWLDEPSWWTTAEAYVEDVRTGLFSYAKQFEDWSASYAADGIARDVQRLFIDDLGVERDAAGANAATEEIGKLLRARYDRGLPTWLTSNLAWGEIHRRYGERVGSRLRETTLIAQLHGGDRRVALGTAS